MSGAPARRIVRDGEFPDDEKTSDHRPVELVGCRDRASRYQCRPPRREAGGVGDEETRTRFGRGDSVR